MFACKYKVILPLKYYLFYIGCTYYEMIDQEKK